MMVMALASLEIVFDGVDRFLEPLHRKHGLLSQHDISLLEPAASEGFAEKLTHMAALLAQGLINPKVSCCADPY